MSPLYIFHWSISCFNLKSGKRNAMRWNQMGLYLKNIERLMITITKKDNEIVNWRLHESSATKSGSTEESDYPFVPVL